MTAPRERAGSALTSSQDRPGTPLLEGVSLARERVQAAWHEAKRDGLRKDHIGGLMQAVMVLERLERELRTPDRARGFAE